MVHSAGSLMSPGGSGRGIVTFACSIELEGGLLTRKGVSGKAHHSIRNVALDLDWFFFCCFLWCRLFTCWCLELLVRMSYVLAVGVWVRIEQSTYMCMYCKVPFASYLFHSLPPETEKKKLKK